MEHPNEFHKILRQILSQEAKPLLSDEEIEQGFAEWYASWNKEDTESHRQRTQGRINCSHSICKLIADQAYSAIV